jgi:hypothetical protein
MVGNREGTAAVIQQPFDIKTVLQGKISDPVSLQMIVLGVVHRDQDLRGKIPRESEKQKD